MINFKNRNILITGASGGIGSALVNGLNQKGINNIWIVDQVDHPKKQNNLKNNIIIHVSS